MIACIDALGAFASLVKKKKKTVHRHWLNIRVEACRAEGHRLNDTSPTQSPPQPPDRCSVTGNEEAGGEEEQRAQGPPSLLLASTFFLPHFSLFLHHKNANLQKPPDLRKESRWRWRRDLRADPRGVSQTAAAPASPSPSEGLAAVLTQA